jgi:DNA-binding transcriptional LysR family regulator
MPDLTSLELLLAIANRGSLSAAGRDIGLTQQAISARMASLEAQTGVRLLVRTTRGSQLTASGAVAAQWADRLLQVAHEVDTGLAALRESSRSRVKVSASLTVAEQLLPGWLVSLQAAAGVGARLRSRSCSPPPTAIMSWTRSAPETPTWASSRDPARPAVCAAGSWRTTSSSSSSGPNTAGYDAARRSPPAN